MCLNVYSFIESSDGHNWCECCKKRDAQEEGSLLHPQRIDDSYDSGAAAPYQHNGEFGSAEPQLSVKQQEMLQV